MDVQATGEAFSPKRENIQHFKKRNLLIFFMFLWVIFALLDPDPDCEFGSWYGSRDTIESGSNPDTDPQHWLTVKLLGAGGKGTWGKLGDEMELPWVALCISGYSRFNFWIILQEVLGTWGKLGDEMNCPGLPCVFRDTVPLILLHYCRRCWGQGDLGQAGWWDGAALGWPQRSQLRFRYPGMILL